MSCRRLCLGLSDCRSDRRHVAQLQGRASTQRPPLLAHVLCRSVCERVCVPAHACCCFQCFERWLSTRVALQLCWLRADRTHNLVSHNPVGVSVQCVLLCVVWGCLDSVEGSDSLQCGLLFMHERPSAAVTSLTPRFFLYFSWQLATSLRVASRSPLPSAEVQCQPNGIKRRVSHLEN